ncbi:exodeoxyribonuclease VII large subunit [[Flexibacter] sp. ATCC 35208]|uniref:exodeoxyribonuclease VII large subunit n=1 Tax=[Flexibacter] sp. ATCC 35208 TaxID=1936242 RepID=UPI0009D3836C|nr:exodeoxyribonuclease VII large subunit [[Flexibacter] sp. ATCC 35208]OMP81158.1 exodeoxyribonuclease VII large subunit [[Flexibacter] sp. ATCC 35208]
MSTQQYITLSQLAAHIQGTIKNAFSRQSSWIVADITSHSFYPAKGYHYFDLVEKDPRTHQLTAKISATAWGNGSLRIRDFEATTGQRFGNDMHVLLQVQVEYHAVYGLKLSMLDIDPSFTIGQLEQQKQATLQRLVTECGDIVQLVPEGYLTRNKKLPLSAVMQKIAVISSPSSAGYQDFMHTLQANAHGYIFHTDNYFTTVQGEANAAQVCAQLQAVEDAGKHYDAVVIIRGGGAQTDLLLFDQYQLGKAVAGFPIPVITGIGHHKNETITDMMAHTATKTPTRAAELIIAHNRQFEDALISIQKQLIIRLQQSVAGKQQQLSALNNAIINRSRDVVIRQKESLIRYNQLIPQQARHLLLKQRNGMIQLSAQVLSKPKQLTASRLQDLSFLRQNIHSFSRKLLQQQQQKLQHHETVVRLMSPTTLLQKGFALVYYQGKLITNATALQSGEDITVQMVDASVQATIHTINSDGNESNI